MGDDFFFFNIIIIIILLGLVVSIYQWLYRHDLLKINVRDEHVLFFFFFFFVGTFLFLNSKKVFGREV